MNVLHSSLQKKKEKEADHLGGGGHHQLYLCI